MITTQNRLAGETLTWDLMKFCKGFKASEISVCTVIEGEHAELTLENWEGSSKSEKIRTLSGVIDVGVFDDIDIILPNSHSYEVFI
ncbi:hypothetical protein D3C76_03350 [compost metagenome]